MLNAIGELVSFWTLMFVFILACLQVYSFFKKNREQDHQRKLRDTSGELTNGIYVAVHKNTYIDHDTNYARLLTRTVKHTGFTGLEYTIYTVTPDTCFGYIVIQEGRHING